MTVPAHDEFVRTLMVFTVFFALAMTQKLDWQIKGSLLFDRLPDSLRQAFNLLNLALCIVFIGLLCWEAFQAAWTSFLEGEYAVGIIRVPLWPAKFALALGSGVLLLQYVTDFILAINHGGKRFLGEPS